ncbi:MAG: Pycsar system effector family protein [Marinifilaceae bacterium]
MNIINETEEFVVDFFKKNHSPIFTYHNLEHTQNVVKQAQKIGSASGLTDEEMEILLLSAWFHDTGYFENFLDHEVISGRIARSFLQERNYPDEKIKLIEECILHTVFPHQHHDHKIADVLCDADLHHLAAKDYIKISERLRDEKISLLHHPISQKSYWEETLNFLKDHCYHTDYGKKTLSKKKEVNLQKVIEKVNTYQIKEIKKLNELVLKLEKQNAKLKAPQRGIETLFRLTARNQINLSSIADSKANLMISVNSIIISAIFFVYRHIDDVPHFIIPCTILLITCLFTIIYSVLATRPNVTTGTFTQEDLKQKKVNLLFFGNFFKMELPDYSKALKGIMKDYDELYESLIKDQYYLGKVLGKKYHLLRISYTIFMYGLIVSVLAFILATVYQPVLW